MSNEHDPIRFNGAALIRARKSRLNGNPALADQLCFNGAALIRARKCQPLNVLPRARVVMLQRGRAHSSAEIGFHPPPPTGLIQRFNGAALIRARK